MRNAARLIRAGAQAVKLEGGRKRLPMVEAHRRRRDPGDGPPRPHAAVGARHGRLQGAGQASSTPRSALVDDAQALADGRLLRHRARGRARRGRPHGHRAGRRARPSASAPGRTATARCSCSTTCSASRTASRPKFVRRYASLKADAVARHRGRTPPTCAPARFPSDEESYHLADDVAEALGALRERHDVVALTRRRPAAPGRRCGGGDRPRRCALRRSPACSARRRGRLDHARCHRPSPAVACGVSRAARAAPAASRAR